ncbi:MAG: ComF family protein [Coriobacteriia bacterium]|nr:ComF family protein [Coriobacteriia bacterium]
MRLLEALTELVYPTRCAGCELPGAVLCDTCRDTLPRIDGLGACPRCGAPYGHLVCTECWSREWAFSAALSLGEFESQLARAVVLHKDAGEQRLGAVLGSLLAEQVASAWPGWAESVTFIPATRAALRRRGFDHGRAIATHVAEQLGLPLSDALVRASAVDQRTLGRVERARNAAGSFSADVAVSGNVLLCDDVFTTGSTLDAAADVLLGSGAEEVRCATVARAW